MFCSTLRGLVFNVVTFVFLLVASLRLSAAPVALAQNAPADSKKTLDHSKIYGGELLLRNKEGREVGICPLKHTDVQANIAGFVARVHVEQTFSNTAKEPVEAIYTFPLPDDAAVDDMTMKIGKRLVKGQIKKREEARQIYEAAKNAGQSAALLDQERSNIFTQSVANLMPGEDITIDISFVNMLKYDDGQYEWAFPTVVGPRYTANTPDANKIAPPITPSATRAGHDISIAVNLDAGLPLKEVTSPLHPIDVKQKGPKGATIKLRDVATLPNKDFILRYKVAGKAVQSGVIAYAPSDDEGGYFTLILQPPDAPKADEIAPKEMVFVIDQTGSQMGWPIEKAKETMSYCLQNLNPGDTFQLIGFTTEVFPCFPAPVAATKYNIHKALDWLKPLAGAGGTDILKAADYALKIPADPKRPRIICQMTDGYVGNEQDIIKHVAANRGQARVFPFGVGNSVNRFLIDGMAREGRGVAEYVLLSDDGQAKAKKFYERVAQPLLLDVSVDWGGLPVEDVLPRQIPDVFSSAPIILKGRYKKGMKGEIRVRGLLRGQPWEEAIPVTLPEEPTQSAEALPSLWAREKINDVEYQGWKDQKTSETPAKITDLALEYRLMSPYTSFVAVEQRIVNIGGKWRTVNVPVEMPEGVSYEGIFGQQADGATVSARYSGGRGAIGGVAKSFVLGSLFSLGGGAAQPAAQPSISPATPQSSGANSTLENRVTSLENRTVPPPKTTFGVGILHRSGTYVPISPPAPISPPLNNPVPQNGISAEKDSVLSLNAANVQKQLDAMKPDERKKTLRLLKLSPALQKAPLPNVKNGYIEVQIWIKDMPADGLNKLKAAGFKLAATLTPNKLLLGTLDAKKLDALLELSFVRRVEAPNFG